MNRNFIPRAHVSSSNDESARKRVRLDEQPAGDFADDDFVDDDLTAEEFDFCLTQVTDATSAQPQTSNANAVPNIVYNGASGRDLQYNLEGQVQLLGRKVASLTRELHSERLSKREELKAQADLHCKELKELKSQVEFKEGELRSVISRQTALEEKLRSHGVETRHRQVVDVGTLTTLCDSGVPSNVKARDIQPTSVVATARRNLPDAATWLRHQHALYPVRSSRSTPTHFDIIRDYVSNGERSTHSADAVALSLRCLGDAITEAAIEASSAGFSIPAEKIVLSSTTHSETFVFDVLAELTRSSDRRLASLSVVALQRLAESSTAQPCIQALRKRDYLSHLASTEKIPKETAIPLLQLVKVALETPDSLTPLFCPAQVRDTCLWKVLSKPFEQEEISIDLLCEAALLAQQALEYKQACWTCFDEFVGKLAAQFGRKLERSLGGVRHESLLLSCFCVVAQARVWHKRQVCRLAALCRSRAEGIEHVWSLFEEDANPATVPSE